MRRCSPKRRIVSRRAVDRDRIDDRIDARAVGQARVHHRRGFVDAPPQRRDDSLDDQAQLPVVAETLVRAFDLAVALDVDRVGPVDHDFGDVRIAHQIFERPEAQRFVDDLAPQLGELFGRARELAGRNAAMRRFPRPSARSSASFAASVWTWLADTRSSCRSNAA